MDEKLETGWLFAIHGWGHRDAAKITYEHLKQDTQRWKDEVGSLVGDTDIYIYPYGSEIEYEGEKLADIRILGKAVGFLSTII